jgi:hypothetical protein
VTPTGTVTPTATVTPTFMPCGATVTGDFGQVMNTGNALYWVFTVTGGQIQVDWLLQSTYDVEVLVYGPSLVASLPASKGSTSSPFPGGAVYDSGTLTTGHAQPTITGLVNGTYTVVLASQQNGMQTTSAQISC